MPPYAAEKNVLLRQKQYRMLEDTEQSLKVAKMIVCGKIKNQISFMQGIKRKFIQKNSKNTNILELITAVKTILSNTEHAGDIDALRGFEGAASKLETENDLLKSPNVYQHTGGGCKNPSLKFMPKKRCLIGSSSAWKK